MKTSKLLDRIIEYSFYLLFLVVPWAMKGDTSELFEFNKMWLTFGISVIIVASWISKMVVNREVKIQRTPLDIFIGLFLLSQILSTVFSLDRYVSFWGYYSRFNGGLLSLITYVILYYAFVTNLRSINIVKKLLKISLISGFVVAVWGLPSHFGYDPTCYVFRNTFDVSCWTADFQPKLRIFSTLGQPDWLSAYLSILIPISLTFSLISKTNEKSKKVWKKIFSFIKGPGIYILLSILFYIDLTWTRSRSGFIAVWISILFLAFLFIYVKKDKFKPDAKKWFRKNYLILSIIVSFLVVNFLIGIPFESLNKGTLPQLLSRPEPVKEQTAPAQVNPITKESGGTESTKIRMIVWKGGLEAWTHYPILGSGVETFAFAYYKYRPVDHNLVSEWNYLYNKAHNEYINYLTTTGILGLGTHLLMIGVFLFLSLKTILKIKKSEVDENTYLSIGLLASYISIVITNFFGFSVVNVNTFFFLIPAFLFIILDKIPNKSFGKQFEKSKDDSSAIDKLAVIIIAAVSIYLIYLLFNFWNADRNYALGSNLNKTGAYQEAYQLLHSAVSSRPNEPVFRDEMAVNSAVMALVAINQQEQAGTQAAQLAEQFAKEAIDNTEKVVADHPNNVVFRKSQVRVYYTLSQVNPDFINKAVEAIKEASKLAPTDANISYNMGVLVGQAGNSEEAIKILQNTIKLKPDYRDAYYALGVFYNQLGEEKNDPDLKQKAIDEMEFILEKIAPQDQAAKDAIETWKK